VDRSHRGFDVVVVGDCNPDIVLRGADVRPEFGQHEKLVPDAVVGIGGSGSITACACARVGLRTRFVGATGDDIFGRFMLDRLHDWGVDTSMCPVVSDVPTGFSVVLSHGADRAILTHIGTIDQLTREYLPLEELAGARHVHVSSYFLQPRLARQLPALIAALRARELTVSLDPNWDPAENWDSGLRSLVDAVDIFLPNAAEARLISGKPETTAATLELARNGTLVVVKDGANGCVAAQGSMVSSHEAFDVACVDTTGAGDAFDAGFLRGWLDGLALQECLGYGCASGALSTRSIGATGALPTIDEVRAVVKDGRRATSGSRQ
jgi:sugar/nucleoside kinase (ribokinase family)